MCGFSFGKSLRSFPKQLTPNCKLFLKGAQKTDQFPNAGRLAPNIFLKVYSVVLPIIFHFGSIERNPIFEKNRISSLSQKIG